MCDGVISPRVAQPGVRKARDEVGVPDASDSVGGGDRLVLDRALSVATILGSEVDDDGATLHHVDHPRLDQLGRGAVGDEGGCDDHVNFARLVFEHLEENVSAQTAPETNTAKTHRL